LLNRSAVLGLGGWRVLQGQFTIGDLVAYMTLAEGFIFPLGELAALGRVTQLIESDLRSLDEVLDEPADPLLESGPVAAVSVTAKLTGRVEMRGISFGYDRAAPPLIRDFSLSLYPGKRVALVGGSGSGKSTLARVLAGLYEPWEGELLFDGVSHRDMPRARLNHSLMFVDQEIVLFAGTVRDNLSLWDATIRDEDLVRAARDADIDDMIAARPGGYDSPVAEGGANFSGGQRQRLEIARALAANPTILIMDEATSALDSVTEKAVVDNLRRRGCTCVVVAHRLSTIRDCEEILVMEAGQVRQRGSHRELFEVEGPYRELITQI
jgi:ABC-type bacteriocin/lantibiotic exporter with double-glycine peptidase domain